MRKGAYRTRTIAPADCNRYADRSTPGGMPPAARPCGAAETENRATQSAQPFRCRKQARRRVLPAGKHARPSPAKHELRNSREADERSHWESSKRLDARAGVARE